MHEVNSSGSWFMVHGSWFMVHGSWFMVHGSWFMHSGPAVQCSSVDAPDAATPCSV